MLLPIQGLVQWFCRWLSLDHYVSPPLLTWWNWPASPTDVPESVPAAIAVDLTASSVALDETKLYNMDGLAPAETKVGRQVRQKS